MKSREVVEVLKMGIPLHFYGPGLGKSTLCEALRAMGYHNVSEAGDENICGGDGSMSVPDNFSGLLIYFEITPSGGNLPGLFQLLNKEVRSELIHELRQMTISEIESFRREWLDSGASEKVPLYCNTLLDLVVQKKMEKLNILKGGEEVDQKTESESYL